MGWAVLAGKTGDGGCTEDHPSPHAAPSLWAAETRVPALQGKHTAAIAWLILPGSNI